tara:strand:- start:70 stop:525 length:456 start_codon:yes stop_codon:yes gene_type:complete
MSKEEKSTRLGNLEKTMLTLITEIQHKLVEITNFQSSATERFDEQTAKIAAQTAKIAAQTAKIAAQTAKIDEQTGTLADIEESGEVVDTILENQGRAIKFLLEHNTVGNEPEYLELLELFGVAHYDGGVETKSGGKRKNKKRRKKTRKKRK